MQRTQSDLDTKVCENCITNYSKYEEGLLELAEAKRKVERIET